AVPDDQRRVYDVRAVIRDVVDGGRSLEFAPRWARNLVCAFARLDGRAVGVIANQPRQLGGVLDADAAQKGARFVRTCNLFGLPREYGSAHLTAGAATREGFIDEVVAPSETRARLAAALTALESGGRIAPEHTNIPL